MLVLATGWDKDPVSRIVYESFIFKCYFEPALKNITDMAFFTPVRLEVFGIFNQTQLLVALAHCFVTDALHGVSHGIDPKSIL